MSGCLRECVCVRERERESVCEGVCVCVLCLLELSFTSLEFIYFTSFGDIN